jgi:hypothetical protein
VGFLDDRDARGLHLTPAPGGDATVDDGVAADAAEAALAAITVNAIRTSLYAARSRIENAHTVLGFLGQHFTAPGDGPGAAIPAIADLGLRGSLDPMVALRSILNEYKAAEVQYRNTVRVLDPVVGGIDEAFTGLDNLCARTVSR